MTSKRIAISTGGGDAPGLNAVIRAIVLSALNRGWECVGIRDGYNGLLAPEDYPEGGLIALDRTSVRGLTHLGGTILGTTNRGNPLRYPVKGLGGQVKEIDRSDELVALFREHRIDDLISIGGDGSLQIAHELYRKGLSVVGVPKTIDNDLDRTVVTFGFDTAVHFATECIDRLHSTAESHQRVLVVEVMGPMPAGSPCTPVWQPRPTPSSSPRSLTTSARSSIKCASASAIGGIFRSSWWPRVRRRKTAAVPFWKKNPPGKWSGSGGSATRSAQSWRS